MKNPTKALMFLLALAAFLGCMFLLPKQVQKSEKFAPLAEQMTSSLPAPKLQQAPAVVYQDANQLQKSPAPAAVGEMTPASSKSAEPKGPDPVVLVQTALAAGDPAKAAAYLDLARERLDASTLQELSGLVSSAKQRMEQQVAAAAKVAAEAAAAKAMAEARPAAAAAAPASGMDPMMSKALIESQTMLASTLKNLQEAQVETNKLVAEMRKQPAAIPALATAPVTSAPAAAPVALASNSTPAPGAVVIKFGFDSSVLEQDEGNKLAPVISGLKADAKAKVQLRGFADKKGDSAYNLGLSNSRALVVKDTLRLAGIADSRVEVLPLGSFSASEQNPDDQRKVEVILIK